ncbi:MAG: hypothetical protein SGJ18_13690 [Pseudomonadota bacterium]|nr:hypothetical protein [Pseudomonadota bacterium]
MITTNKIVVAFISFTLVTITYSNCSQVPTGSLYSSSEYCKEPQQQNCKGNLYEVGFDSAFLPAYALNTGNAIIGYTGACYAGGYPVAKIEYRLFQSSNNGDYQWKGNTECVGGQFIINSTTLPSNFTYGQANHLLLSIKVYDSVDSNTPLNKIPKEAVVPISSTAP